MQRNALINTPGSIKADMDTVRGLVESLDADIRHSKVSAQFREGWDGFKREWEKFYDEHQSYWSRWWYAAEEKTEEYRRRLSDWRKMFVAEGGKPSTPEDHLQGDGARVSWWKVGAIGAGILGGLALLGAVHHHHEHEHSQEGDDE